MNTWTDIREIKDELEHVTKFVFTNESAVAEAVLYRYPDYETRTVICCSTQSGCPIGCRFCGAGDNFVRSLTTDEIVDQVKHCIEKTNVNPSDMKRIQIMFMSMGEPMLNTKNLIPALHMLHSLYPNAYLLISTSGPSVDYIPIIETATQIDKIGLQFSVHESTDEQRDKLIPFKNKLTLDKISLVGQAFCIFTDRKPFFNYCAHDNNVSDDDASRLFTLFNPKVWCATVSVICERDEYRQGKNEHQRQLALDFGNKLVSKGYDVRVFDPAGQDTIGGGCGQLWFVQDWMKNNPDKARPTVGNGLPVIHVPTESSQCGSCETTSTKKPCCS